MKLRTLLIMFFGVALIGLLLAPIACFSQATDSMIYVKQFPGSDVGTKVGNAMASCNPDTLVPCLLVIDPSLARFNAGTIPTLCSQCYLVDWREGPPIYSSSVNYKVPVPVGPAFPVPPLQGLFVVTGGTNAADCVGSSLGSFTNVCVVGPSGPFVINSGAAAWGLIGGSLSSQTDLQAALNSKAPAPVSAPLFTANFTVVTGFQQVNCPSGCTAALPAISHGFTAAIQNIGTTGAVTISGSPYDGQTTLQPGGKQFATIFEDGTTWHSGNLFNSKPDANGGVLASINSMINVMAPPYNAKGDCTTNDTTAFSQAQSDAIAFGTAASSAPYTLWLPVPPGGCYIVSNLTYQGVPMIGPDSNLVAPYVKVKLKSLPGNDILHVPDPTTTSGTIKLYPGWFLKNISFVVDNSTAGSFSNRSPGRYFGDAGMTASSAVLTTLNGDVTCADVGQAIQVNGAGSGGANLVTTVLSVSPCWTNSPSWQVITLAAAASTTVTNAQAYISMGGLPVTQHVNQCAFAQDMQDGNSADWVAGSYTTGNYPKLENIDFGVTTGAYANYTCAMYTQGNPIFYGMDARNIHVQGSEFGIVQQSTVLNSNLANEGAGDYQHWDHMLFLPVAFAWISDNGLDNKLTHVQITGNSAVHIFGTGNIAGDGPIGWTIDYGYECPYSPNCNAVGSVITGGFHSMAASLTSGASGQYGYWEANNSSTTGTEMSGNYLHLDGNGNTLQLSGPPSNFTNTGQGNVVTYEYNASPFAGIPIAYPVSAVSYKGSNELINRFTPDFLQDGNYSTPYNHDDLFVWPTDVIYSHTGSPWGTVVVADTDASNTGANGSGYYLNMAPGLSFTQFAQGVNGGNTGSSFVFGTNLPAAPTTVYLKAKCLSGSSFSPYASASTSNNPTFSCTTSYQIYKISATFSGSDIGSALHLGMAGSTTAQVAWWDVVPNTTLNGTGTTGSGAAIPTGPTSAAVAHSFACFASTSTGQLEDGSNNSSNGCVQSSAGTLTPTWKTSAGHSYAIFQKSAVANVAGFQVNDGGTAKWAAGAWGDDNFDINDSVASRKVLSFPINTMPANSITGNSAGAQLLVFQSNTNCSSSASPAVCAAAPSGSVAVAASATTVVVDTTAVTANSQILLQFDASLGTKLSVTCNTTFTSYWVSARTSGTSFTITVSAAPTTNPACFSYTIVN